MQPQYGAVEKSMARDTHVRLQAHAPSNYRYTYTIVYVSSRVRASMTSQYDCHDVPFCTHQCGSCAWHAGRNVARPLPA
eukprot:42745-Eustigmatos_ZCMA.PRE.1